MAINKFLILLTSGVSLTAAGVIDSTSLTKRQSIDSCPGYKASNVQTSADQVTGADLTLAGDACNAYGTDLQNLKLEVEYQTNDRLHVIIYDADQQVYQVPESVLPRPESSTANSSDLVFSIIEDPFSFAVSRKGNAEVLFNTSGSEMIFESQYLRLRTSLPDQPHLYGLGEHTDPFMLNTTNYTRTLWNREAPNVPTGTSLYGSHPIYFDHRGSNGTHGVFLLNSNGMDIEINNTAEDGQYLEYNTLGGVFDFYFLNGPSPTDVASQYADVVGHAAMHSYWTLGFHQCRYGMQDIYEVAAVVANYSQANIPLEIMWTDIDYMDLRKVFSLDPVRFPIDLVRQLVDYLHGHQQHYIVMVDPAVAYQNYSAFNDGVDADAFLKISNGSIYQGVVWPGVTAFPDWFASGTQGYWNSQFDSFFSADTGVDIDAIWNDMNEVSNFCPYPCTDPAEFARTSGDPPHPPLIRLGPPYAIPGFPDDFQPQCVAQVSFNVNASTYSGEGIAVLGSAVTLGEGDPSNAAPLNADSPPIWNAIVDLPPNTTVTYQYVRLETDSSYIYEPTNRSLTTGGCDGTIQTVNDNITSTQGTPPTTSSSAKRSVFPTRSRGGASHVRRQTTGDMKGLSGRDLINPPYQISDPYGNISQKTLNTDLVHQNGLVEYDTHNYYGTMMAFASRNALLSRRPTVRPLVITRSTFSGAGRNVGHWLGDNASDWPHYLISIAELLEFGALFQIPMVGSDVCGYNGNTNSLLCARWATLGAFSPFYRNHEGSGQIPQEFYRWPIVASAARNAIATRYQLLDYIYTALYAQNQTGTPIVNPMFFIYPNDTETFALQYQYFYGSSILVAPVTTENSTVGSVYLPNDQFYDYYTHAAITGNGSTITLPNVPYDTIPLYIRGGSIIPLRSESANTTTELRKKDFEVIIAPGIDGSAKGTLYFDDGDSLVQEKISEIEFNYEGGVFSMSGSFGYDPGVSIGAITLLSPEDSSSSGGNGTQKREEEIVTGNHQSKRVAGSRTLQMSVPLTKAFRMKLSS